MILVTGGTGHIGSHVLYELIKKHASVRALYRNRDHINRTREVFSYYESGEDAFNQIEWVAADINDYYSLISSLRNISLVFHTAGYVTFNDKEKDKLYHVNAEGTANVVNACLESGNTRLCHVSSVATLGKISDNLPVTEGILWNHGKTASAYAKSKYHAEMEVWRGINEGLDAFIVNPSVIIGPGMWLGPGSMLWQSVLQGLRFYPAGSAGYIDVRDLAFIMIKLSEMKITGERFIVNAGHMAHREFLSLLAKGLNVKEPDIRITPFLSNLALVIEAVRAFVSRSEKRFNHRTIKIASENLSYSGEKLRSLTQLDYLPVEESIRSATEIYNYIKTKNI